MADAEEAATAGRDVLLEVLRTEGVRHVFGNPGSTELPLIDTLAGVDDIHYVLALQEATVAGMADGYAQATGRPAFLNLHTSAGLGNAVGNLTNAMANGAPLVVTAGQQDERHLAADPLLSGPLTEIAAPTCKWTHEVRSLGELGTILRRAFADAPKAPAGPVFVSMRMDLLDRRGPASSVGAPPRSRIVEDASAGGLEELADLVASPAVGRVGVVVGDEVATAGAQATLAALAEALGAPVHGAPLHSREVFDPTHPLYAGMLAPSAAAIRAALEGYDRVLLVGGHAFLVYPYAPGSPVPEGTELLHLAPASVHIGRAHPVRLGLVGGVAASLAALLPLVQARADAGAAADALQAAAERRSQQLAGLDETARSRYGPAPMHPMAAAHALAAALPAGTAVVDEAITTGGYLRGFHHRAVDDGYFFCKGGGLGWGMPAACGVSLARDRSPVLCAVGDGSALYSPQALWTAAREQLPVVFAVVDNGQYRILKDYLRGMGGTAAATGRFVGMDLEPAVDFVGLASSLGVPATPVASAADVGDAVAAAIDAGGPHLLHLPISAP
jgi:benzoylformate decarboxylase